MGAVALARELPQATLADIEERSREAIDFDYADDEGARAAAHELDIADAMACEIAFENDDFAGTPEQRWQRMRDWAAQNLRAEATP